MKISDFKKLESLVDQRRQLFACLKTVGEAGGLTVMIGAAYQDTDFVDAVRPHVIAILEHRLADIRQKFWEIGVELDETPDLGEVIR